jgi:hypothetical protein
MYDHLKSGGTVSSVAFGDQWDSYFIVFASGSYAYQKVPAGFTAKMQSRGWLSDLKMVTLGSSGQWYLAVRNGRFWCGGIDNATRAIIGRRALEYGHLHRLWRRL